MAFEQADAHNFWADTKRDMQAKMARFVAVFDELGLPYSVPEGGYFVLANLAKVELPEGYDWPEQVRERPRDFRMAWWLIMEFGVAAIPPSEFMTDERVGIVEDYMRFAVCKDDEVLERAKERLRGLAKYIK